MLSINCKGRLLSLQKPVVMGILNATPDSFYQGNIAEGINGMVQKAKSMTEQGADILDIGGQSTRPSATLLTEAEEAERVLPVIAAVHTALPHTIISIDTFYSSIAAKAVAAGASIVNDISGGEMDKDMIATVAKLNVPYICMHIQGTPQTMQQNPMYENVTKEVLEYFIKKIYDCKTAGIKDVIIDPGFGFGKTLEHNYELLQNLSLFKILEKPILAGLSRKGMIYKPLGITPSEALNGTTVLNTIALLHGANILRVHDVREAAEAIKLIGLLPAGYQTN